MLSGGISPRAVVVCAILVAAVTAASVAGCHATGSSTDDSFEHQSCESENVCAKPCTANYECASDLCVAGVCLTAPDGEIDLGSPCGPGDRCVPDGTCEDGVCTASGCSPACTINEICDIVVCIPRVCIADYDCGDGAACTDNVCTVVDGGAGDAGSDGG